MKRKPREFFIDVIHENSSRVGKNVSNCEAITSKTKRTFSLAIDELYFRFFFLFFLFPIAIVISEVFGRICYVLAYIFREFSRNFSYILEFSRISFFRQNSADSYYKATKCEFLREQRQRKLIVSLNMHCAKNIYTLCAVTLSIRVNILN